MKRVLLWLALALATAAWGASADLRTPYLPELKPAWQQARAAHMAAELLGHYHYRRTPLDEALSKKIFDEYLKSLDSEKLVFVQADIDRFSAGGARLGDAIRDEDLSIPFSVINLYQRRAVERYTYARSLLKKGFDFRKLEHYQYSREKEAWPKTESEIRELWRKRVKNEWLRLRLVGKDDKSIAEILDKRYDNFLKRVARIKSADAFQAFMNAFTTAIEPHTNYLVPRAAEEFDIAMKLSLVGIGAVLAEKDDYTTIRKLVPGGPAALSGQLKSGDRIVGVAQGAGGAMTDILGWRVEDAVALIRGAPDSVVVLDVLPEDAVPEGKRKRVSLVRKTISLEERAARSSVHSVQEGKINRRIGVIALPSFYEDFAAKRKGDRHYRSATRDVSRLLEKFRKEKVDSVLMDLRNNGGGSLAEAIELTGLFIDKGPVVQQRNARGEVLVMSDTQAGVAWDGPLGVLLNRGSASASEIFAAAIQDYGRGLIIGDSSFGKGTVQNMIDLDLLAKSNKPQFGELKMTVAQFFRVNGGTTQLHGVMPDILLPAVSHAESFGESSFDNALPWAQVKAADYKPVGDVKSVLPILVTLHEARVKRDREFQYLKEDIAELTLQRRKKSVSLNEAERRRERDRLEARLRSRELRKDRGANSGAAAAGKQHASAKGGAFRDDGLQSSERDLAVELAAEDARKNAKDVLLNEAVNILGDELGVLQTGARLASRIKPDSLLGPEQKRGGDPALDRAQRR